MRIFNLDGKIVIDVEDSIYIMVQGSSPSCAYCGLKTICFDKHSSFNSNTICALVNMTTGLNMSSLLFKKVGNSSLFRVLKFIRCARLSRLNI